MKKLILLLILAALTGCAITPAPTTVIYPEFPTPRINEEQRSYIDKTVSVPNLFFMETPESKSVLVGSSIFAQAAGCQFMQRYKVRTNATFSESLNLLKYRSAMMGAKRLTIFKHEEVDASEGRISILDDVVYIRAGTSLYGANYHTTIVADLYDCIR
jgi:hypothetical protein